jgi:hypothetical protein|tara:strand:- start:1384 stop:1644 length:261 start_codon:yes stop_codon:yes gene_type:complete
MKKHRILPDGCDIAVYDSQGTLLIEYSDIDKEVATNALNTLNQLILNEQNRRRAKEDINDKEMWDRLDEVFDIRAKKLMPKPQRQM